MGKTKKMRIIRNAARIRVRNVDCEENRIINYKVYETFVAKKNWKNFIFGAEPEKFTLFYYSPVEIILPSFDFYKYNLTLFTGDEGEVIHVKEQ